jgi:hypothetical protein
LQYIIDRKQAGETLIVAGEWWNYWPLKYLGSDNRGIFVLTRDQAENETEKLAAATKAGRAWHVEFSESGLAQKIEADLTSKKLDRHDIRDYAGRPILTLLRPK